MPRGWVATTLADLADVNPEQLGSRTDPGFTLEYLDIAAITSPGVIGSTRRLTFAKAPSRARRRVRAGDILVSTVRPYLRNFGRIRKAPRSLVASTGYTVVRPRAGVSGSFLYQHVLSDRFVQFLKPRMRGSNYPAVNHTDVAMYGLPLPPLTEQRKIAAILSSVDDAIERTQAVIDQVQVVRRGLLQQLLTQGMPNQHNRYKRTDIGTLPESWKVVPLGDIAAVKGGKRMPIGRPFADSVTPYPYVRVCDFKNGTVDSSAVKYVLLEDRDQIRRYTISRDDVYISIAGTLGIVGTVPPELDGAQLTENAAKIVLKDKVSSRRDFVRTALESDGCQAQLTKLRGVGGGVPKLALFRIEQVRLPLPAVTEQKEIVGVFESIREYRQTLSAKLDAAKQLKSALMSVLLTGELRVTPDPEAE